MGTGHEYCCHWKYYTKIHYIIQCNCVNISHYDYSNYICQHSILFDLCAWQPPPTPPLTGFVETACRQGVYLIHVTMQTQSAIKWGNKRSMGRLQATPYLLSKPSLSQIRTGTVSHLWLGLVPGSVWSISFDSFDVMNGQICTHTCRTVNFKVEWWTAPGVCVCVCVRVCVCVSMHVCEVCK